MLSLQARFHHKAVQDAVAHFWLHPFASLMTILVIAMTLVFPVFFWVLTGNIEAWARSMAQKTPMVVYMPLLADKAAEQALLQKIQSLPEVASVKIKTKEEALQELQQQEGMKDVLAYLPQNPLPTVLEVLPESRDLTEWKHLQKKIQGLSFVEEVRLSLDIMKRLEMVFLWFDTLVHISCGILSVAVMLIIANTLRLTIYQRQEEMQVYKLLGATDAYVSRPFLYSGMAYAFFGALLALLLVKAVLLSISRSNVFVMHQDLLQLHQRQVFAVLIISLLLGWVSAKLCVKIKNSYLYL